MARKVCKAFSYLTMILLLLVSSLQPISVADAANDFSNIVEKNIRELANQGNADAQYNLGFMYDLGGLGVPQDYKEALKWFRKAADQGHASAQYNLGNMYRNGYGVPQDYKEALKWYRKAADQGYASAQNNLGNMYRNGYGVPQDYVKAHMWINLAAAQGNEDTMKNRALLADKMTSEQIAEAQKLAREWKPLKP